MNPILLTLKPGSGSGSYTFPPSPELVPLVLPELSCFPRPSSIHFPTPKSWNRIRQREPAMIPALIPSFQAVWKIHEKLTIQCKKFRLLFGVGPGAFVKLLLGVRVHGPGLGEQLLQLFDVDLVIRAFRLQLAGPPLDIVSVAA